MTVMWGDCPQADIMDAFRSTLRGVSAERIGTAIRMCPVVHPEWPPTAGQFLALCKAQPQAHRPIMLRDMTRGDPAPEVKTMLNSFAKPKLDPKAWARELMAKHEAGERLLPIQVQFAREALGL